MLQLVVGPVVGFALLAAMLLLAGLPVDYLLHPAAALLVLGPFVGAVCIACSPALLQMMLRVLRRDPTVAAADCLIVEQRCSQLGRMAVLAALIGLVLLGIALMGDFSLPATIRGMAIGAACITWGFGCKLFVTLPIENAAASLRHGLPASSAAAGSTLPLLPPRAMTLAGALMMLCGWVGGFGSLSVLGMPLNVSKIIFVLPVPVLLAWMSRMGRRAGAVSWIESLANQATAAVAAGTVASVVGISAMMESLNPEKLLAGSAAAMTGIAYGLMLYFTLSALALPRMASTRRAGPLEGIGHYLWALVLLILIVLGVIYAIAMPIFQTAGAGR